MPDLERDLEGYYRAWYNLDDDDEDSEDPDSYVYQQHSIERFKYIVISSSLLSSSLSLTITTATARIVHPVVCHTR